MSKIETYTAEALDLLNAGFSSKAAQKRALSAVSYAFDEVKKSLHSICLADRELGGGKEGEWNDLYYGPLNLHEFTEKKFALYGRYDVFASDLETIRRLRDLREVIKSAAIVPPAKDETKVLEARVVETIKARMERLQVRYLEAIDLSEVFEDGVVIHGLHANSHYVTNDRGTTFLRTFYYIHGRLTPLNLIIAAAQEKRRQVEAK